MTKTINVEIKVGAETHVLPFVLFVGWTIDQRRKQVQTLQTVKELVDAKVNPDKSVSMLLVEDEYTELARSMLAKLGGHSDTVKQAWLKTQINMMAVPELRF